MVLCGGVEIVVDVDYHRFAVESGMAKKNIKAIVRSIPHEEKDELRAKLLKLSEACPFHHDNPEDCPLFRLRKMKASERLQWVNALAENDLEYLAAYHRVCFTTRVEAGLAKQRTTPPVNRGSRRIAGQ